MDRRNGASWLVAWAASLLGWAAGAPQDRDGGAPATRPAASSAVSWPVTVLDRTTGLPLAAGEVSIHGPARIEAARAVGNAVVGVELPRGALLERRAPDAAGRIDLGDLPVGPYTLFFRGRDLVGRADLDTTPSGIGARPGAATLSAFHPQVVDVRVLDRDEGPVSDAWVYLGDECAPPLGLLSSGEPPWAGLVAPTDGAGRVRFFMMARGAPWLRHRPLEVGVLRPGGGRVYQRRSSHDLEGEIVLRVARTRHVRFAIQDEAGGAADGPVQVRWLGIDALPGIARPTERPVAPRVSYRPAPDLVVRGGAFALGAFEPDTPIEIEVDARDCDRATHRVLAGSAETTHVLAVGPRARVLLFDLVDDDGPRADFTDLRARLASVEGGMTDPEWCRWRPVERTAEGRFRIACDGRPFTALAIHSEGRVAEAWAGGEAAHPVGVALVGTLRPSEVRDLGSLRLQRDPVLVAGRALDETGAPVPDAGVRVSAVARSIPGRRWHLHARTDAAGRFVLRGRPRGYTDYEIVADRGSELRSHPLRFSPDPAAAVDVELIALGRVAGRLVVRGELDPFALRIRLVPRDGGPGACFRLGFDGRFEVTVMPGPYDLIIETRFREAESITTSVDVASRQTATVADLVLPGEWRRLLVRVVRASGRPVPLADVSLVPDDRPGESPFKSTDVAGHAWLWTRVDRPWVVRVREGSSEEEIRDPTFPLTVVLRGDRR